MISREYNSRSVTFSSGKTLTLPKQRKNKKELICTLHVRIQVALAKIELCMQGDDPRDMKHALLALRDAQDAVEAALVRGQAMEDRLKEYRNAIESLGFKRITK